MGHPQHTGIAHPTKHHLPIYVGDIAMVISQLWPGALVTMVKFQSSMGASSHLKWLVKKTPWLVVPGPPGQSWKKTPGTGEKLTFWTPLIEGTTELLGMTEASSLVVRGSSSSMINAHWLFRLTSEFPEILKWQPHTFVSGYVFSLCYATIQPPRLLLQWNCSE